MSLHIQAPKKVPAYEEEDNDMGLFAYSTTILDTCDLLNIWKSPIHGVYKYYQRNIYFKIHKLQMLYMNVLLNLQGVFLNWHLPKVNSDTYFIKKLGPYF